jgi:AraC-like DNA-binding protein
VKGLAFMIDKFRIPHCEIIPMTDPAEALGYTNERQLFRMFKKLIRKTPGQFRREKNNSPAVNEAPRAEGRGIL